MKKITALVVGAMLMMATSAMAYTVDSGATDVGGLDAFVAKASLGNSGDAAELAWVNTILQPDVTWVIKTDTNDGDGWKLTDTAGVYAFDLIQAAGPSEYFMVKLGNNNNSGFTDFLFKNEANLDWAVLSLASSFDTAAGVSIKEIEKFSHIVEFNGATPVPEPGTMMLLGMGMFGMAIYGKRRMHKES